MLPPATAERARISEIFSSLQGEGTHLGERHLFVRFGDCPVRCSYCDEANKPAREMMREEVLTELVRLERGWGPHRFVSLTGGEPLYSLPFLLPLLDGLKALGYKNYLETSGILWEEMAQAISSCDAIAMDMKPASVTGLSDYRTEHRRFLAIAKAKEVFVKIAVSSDLVVAEFDSLIGIVADTAAQTPVILQAVSGRMDTAQDPQILAFMEGLQRRALRVLEDVRILPRLHCLWKLP
ncbi:MAG: 7-carboxy-7-deazaguanine synthase QueE [Candidatus Omnitrophota bacterium]|jgi:organic radical activating enzyme